MTTMSHRNRELDAAAMAAFDHRCERRDAREQEAAAKAGATHSRCDDCGEVRNLNWLGGECNSGDGLSWSCGGVYRPYTKG